MEIEFFGLYLKLLLLSNFNLILKLNETDLFFEIIYNLDLENPQLFNGSEVDML